MLPGQPPIRQARPASPADLRRLYQTLLQQTEDDRSRMARQIHNELGQSLTAIKMAVKGAQRQVNAGPATVAERLELAERLLDESIQTVRHIAADLRPGLLDHFGLGAAVEWQIQQSNARSVQPLHLHVAVDESQITPAMATAAFRILQEALTHQMDAAITVKLVTADNTLVLTVQVAGVSTLTGGPVWPDLAVLGMHERAQSLGGSTDVVESAAEGTTLLLWLPIRQASEDNA